MPTELPPDASPHLRDLWHARGKLLDQLAIDANPGSVVVQLSGALVNVDRELAAVWPEFTSAPVKPAGGTDLDEFTRRAQAQAARRAG